MYSQDAHQRTRNAEWRVFFKLGWCVLVTILLLAFPLYSGYKQPSPAQDIISQANAGSSLEALPQLSSPDALGRIENATLPLAQQVEIRPVIQPEPPLYQAGGQGDAETVVTEKEAPGSTTRHELRPVRLTPLGQESARRLFRRSQPDYFNLPGLEEVEQGYRHARRTLFTGAKTVTPNDNPFNGGWWENPPPIDGRRQDLSPVFPEIDSSNNAGGRDTMNSQPLADPLPDESSAGETDNDGSSGSESSPGDDSGRSKKPRSPQPESPGIPSFGVLLVGASGADSIVAGAWQQNAGGLLLENGNQLDFVGHLRTSVAFSENERILISDYDDDGLNDLVKVRRITGFGSSLESFLQTSPGVFEPHASASFYLQDVRSMAFFDFNRDGVRELALVLTGEPNLVIFEHVDGRWGYVREVVLPFPARLLMTSGSSTRFFNERLYVIDPKLNSAVSISAEEPNRLNLGAGALLRQLRSLDVDFRRDGETEVLVLSLPDSVLLVEKTGIRLDAFAAVSLDQQVPWLMIGDLVDLGSRQTYWAP